MTRKLVLYVLFVYCFQLCAIPEKIAVIFIFDQLSFDAFNEIKDELTGGIKFLLDNGITYQNAYWPHFIPSTGPGHAGLSTGAVPSIHGIIDNNWFDKAGNEIDCDFGDVEEAGVFSIDGFYDFGKSPQQLKVDTISDQVMLKSRNRKNNAVFSFALKSRGSILTAGRLGKAFWFDEKNGYFTSSKAYFNKLPPFIVDFNQTHTDHFTQFLWQPIREYQEPTNYYRYTRAPQLFNSPIQRKNFDQADKYFELFQQTPEAHRLLLEAAKSCLRTIAQEINGIAILWIGLSGTDKVGHVYGPTSAEYQDIILQTDQYLKEFIDFVYSFSMKESPLFILTSDHGSMPIPELLKEKNFDLAHRINSKKLTEQLNEKLNEMYGSDLIRYIDPPSVYLNHDELDQFARNKQKQIMRQIKNLLKKEKGIKRIWTFHELKNKCAPDIIEQHAKNHLFPGRTGDLLFQVYPYVYASPQKAGTGHKSPYNYDTHVPLIICQQDNLGHKEIIDKICLQQLAPTLAKLLHIPAPSTSSFSLLPGIF